MKTQSIIAAAVLSITGAAFAQGEATYEYPQAVSASKSRVEVQNEARQARAAGQIASGEIYAVPSNFVATKSHAEVRTLAAAGSRRPLPLNVEAISFDGRSVAQRAADESLVASARR